MKNSSRLLLAASIVCVLMMVLISCKKNEVVFTSETSPTEKITAWLDRHKSGKAQRVDSASGQNANIEMLKANLDFASLKKEYRDEKHDFLIIPIKDEVISKKDLSVHSTLNLLLFTDKVGNVLRGNIIYFIPEDNKKHQILPGTYQKIFYSKPVEFNGTYRFLSVTGRWLTEYGYKDGRLASYGKVVAGDKMNQRIECTDWYLVTTYYYDGTTYETRQYLGKTCTGCNSDMFQGLCPPDEGGGGNGSGGGSTDPDPDFTETFQGEEESDQANYNDDDIGYVTDNGLTVQSDFERIKYRHPYTYTRNQVTRIIDPGFQNSDTYVQNRESTYTDVNGYTVKRKLDCWGHINQAFLSNPTTINFSWQCYVWGSYTWPYGQVKTQQWSHSHSKTIY